MTDELSDDTCNAPGKSTRKRADGEAHLAYFSEPPETYWENTEAFPQPAFPMILVGLDTIAKAVGAGNKAILRWIREEDFPARRNTDGIYRADPGAVRRWFATSCLRDRP